MPFARWIKNKNDRLVCVWNEDMKMSSVHSRDTLPVVKSGVNEVFVAIFTAVPFGKTENIRPVDAKQVLANCCKLAA
jgi:hypothetical protein